MIGRYRTLCITLFTTLFIWISTQHGLPAVERHAAQLTLVPTLVRTEHEGLPSGVEFAPQDLQLLALVRKGAAAKLAARRLRDSPDSPETIRLLEALR